MSDEADDMMEDARRQAEESVVCSCCGTRYVDNGYGCSRCEDGDCPRKCRDVQHKTCQMCGAPATCYGAYEGNAPGYSCDACCGHGCEDGQCEMLPSCCGETP